MLVSKSWSSAVLLLGGITWLALLPYFTILLEYLFTHEILTTILSFMAPACSITAMSSPLLVVFHAIRTRSSNHGLQWPLFIGFGTSTILGIAYGFRMHNHSIICSNSTGFTLQCISLGAVYDLSSKPTIFADYIAQKLMFITTDPLDNNFHPSRFRQLLSLIIKWLIYILILIATFGLELKVALKVPLNTVLAPIFALSCLFPYCATFSTLRRDVRNYRAWTQLPKDSAAWHKGPAGVDLTTLWVMQVNNMLWAIFGLLIKDEVISISSLAGVFLAGIQIISYQAPTVVWTVQIYNWTFQKQVKNSVVIDPGCIFVGCDYFIDWTPFDDNDEESGPRYATDALVRPSQKHRLELASLGGELLNEIDASYQRSTGEYKPELNQQTVWTREHKQEEEEESK